MRQLRDASNYIVGFDSGMIPQKQFVFSVYSNMEPAMETVSREVWEDFVVTGACNEALVAPPILRSWQRCAQIGLAARAPHPALASAPAAVLDAAHEALVTLARPYLEDLYQFVEGSGFAVLLTDPALT